MKELSKYIKDYKKECVLGPLFKLLEACFDLTVPIVMAKIIDDGIAKNDSHFILVYGGVLILLAAVGLLSSITAQYFAAKAAVGFATNLRHGLFKHIESLSFTEMDTVGISTLITRMTSDINQMQSGVNLALRLFLRSPFIVFGAAVMAFTVDVKAAVVFAVVIPLLAIVVLGIMVISMPLYRKVQAGLDKILGRTRQNLTGVRVIRAFDKEEAEKVDFNNENQTLTNMQLLVGKIAALTNPMTYILLNAALVVLLYVGAIRVDGGMLTQGMVIALVNYMSQILVELIKLANTIVVSTKAVACGKRIQSIFEMKPSITDDETDSAVNDGDSESDIDNALTGEIEDGLGDAEIAKTGEIGNSLKKAESDTEKAPVSAPENDFQGAEVVFDNTLASTIAKAKAEQIVEEAIEKAEEHIMVLNQFVPWQEYIFSSTSPKADEIQFVVFPSNRGGYNWQCVPDGLGSFGQRKSVPEEWKGLRDDDIQKVTGIDTATFCHPAGFIGGAETFADAYALAKKAVEA